MGIERLRRTFGTAALAAVLAVTVAACGEQQGSDGAQQGSGGSQERAASSGDPSGGTSGAANPSGETTTTETTGGDRASGEAAELARAEVGNQEIQNMLPADGRRPDEPQPLPEDPPEGIEVYPATTNDVTGEPIDYGRQPPTNGDHDPLWQNCGVYEQPIKDRHAVHSMDHGVVWISHQPDLPASQIEELRSYGDEDYVIVSPYPGLDAPVTATSWRVQLDLEGADDPRLRQFVDGFKNSELAPLSGNRCSLGVGNPA